MCACVCIAKDKERDAIAGLLLCFFFGPLGLLIEGFLPSLVERRLLEEQQRLLQEMLKHLAEINPQEQVRINTVAMQKLQAKLEAQADKEAEAQVKEHAAQVERQRKEAEKRARERVVADTRRQALMKIDDLVKLA
jgi:hypothetical protein